MMRHGRFAARVALAATAMQVTMAVAAEQEPPAEAPLYLSLDTPEAPVLQPGAALGAFALAPGFAIDLVASEPLVEDPVAVAWDEDGRLYVAEMRGFMPDTFGTGQTDPVGMVVRLTDTDGDGRPDRREVLLDALVLPRAVAVVNAGLLVGEPPALWLCPSPTGRANDIDCSARRRIGAYGDPDTSSVEHDENGLLLGLDNWLYSAKSNRRLRLRGSELEVETTLFRGQWGITQDDDGRLYYNTNSNLLSGDFYSAEHVVRAGSTTAAGLNERVHRDDEVFSIRVNPGVNRAYLPGVLRADGRLRRPTSASGMAAYRGSQFPAEYRGDVFVTEPAANAVAQLRLTEQGLAIGSEHVLYHDAEWGQREFLASTDERFRPVDVKVGPDGALYVVDMYRGILQDHVFITEELRAQILERGLDRPLGLGRIWRVTHAASPVPTAAPNLSSADAGELLALLRHDNGWLRDTAQRLLRATTEPGVARRLAEAASSERHLEAIHALWTLEGRGELDRNAVLAALGHPHDAVARHGLRAGETLLTDADLIALARDELPRRDAAFAQQVALSLGARNGNAGVRQQLAAIFDAAWADPYRRAAVRASLGGIEVEFLDALLARGAWSRAREDETGFAAGLSRQAFRAAPERIGALLDWVAARRPAERWIQQAVLGGLFEATRDPAFARVVLAAPHPLFALDDDDALWPFVARARRGFTWSGDDLDAGAAPLSPSRQARMAQGAEWYARVCANCHGRDGRGAGALGPPLVDSRWMRSEPERLARIVLHGMHGPIEIAGETWNSTMPGQATSPEFTDDVASGLLTYLHRSWGEAQHAIDPEFISQIRADTGNHGPWTVSELLDIPVNTHYRRYAGRYGSASAAVEFVYDGARLLVNPGGGPLSGPLVDEGAGRFRLASRDVRLEFSIAADGSVPAVRLLRASGEGSPLPRIVD